MQGDISPSITKGEAHERIKELEANKEVQLATPGQINVLREAMPKTPLDDIKKITKESASRLINAYFQKKKASKGKGKGPKDKDSDKDKGSPDKGDV